MHFYLFKRRIRCFLSFFLQGKYSNVVIPCLTAAHVSDSLIITIRRSMNLYFILLQKVINCFFFCFRIASMVSNLPKENVWNYPRPPAIEPVQGRLRVIYNETVLADTTSALRILETGHPPTYYIPPQDVKQKYLKRNTKSSFCEYKGLASYYDFYPPNNQPIVSSRIWSYGNPNGTHGKFSAIKDYYSFYVGPWDCYFNEEKVEAQPGDFYGGWKTKNIEGKANAGSGAWGL